MDGRVFELNMAHAIHTNLPEIAKQLKRIADAMEARNQALNVKTEGKG